MPKVSMNYENTILYKIVCKDLSITDLYVGHTTNFNKRKGQHKFHCNTINSKGYNLLVYQFIRTHGGWDNWTMIEIEKYKCADKLEACKKERHWIEILNATLNKQVPSRTKKQYYTDNKEVIKQQQKQYKNDNVYKIKEFQKQYYTDNKDKIKEFQKQYRDENKDKFKQYRDDNKDKFKAKSLCQCGGQYTYQNKSHHLKSNKHQEYLTTQKDNLTEIELLEIEYQKMLNK